MFLVMISDIFDRYSVYIKKKPNPKDEIYAFKKILKSLYAFSKNT